MAIECQAPKKRLVVFRGEDGELRVGAYNGFTNDLLPPLGTFSKCEEEFAYHYTYHKYLTHIFEQGLDPGEREGVHMASLNDQWLSRKDSEVMIKVNVKKMQEDGLEVYKLNNGVIMHYGRIPVEYLEEYPIYSRSQHGRLVVQTRVSL